MRTRTSKSARAAASKPSHAAIAAAVIALSIMTGVEGQSPVVTSHSPNTADRTATQIVVVGSQPVTVTKAPMSGAFEPPSFTGPNEMIFRFDIAPASQTEQHPNRYVVLVPPPGFALNQNRFEYLAMNGLHGEAIIRRSEGKARGRVLVATIIPQPAAGQAVGSAVEPLSTTYFNFTYVPLVEVHAYFFLGALGIALGYLVRMAKKLLDSTEPPPHRIALAKAEALRANATTGDVPPTTPQRLFWKYWYVVDFGVTVVLGIVVLITLMQNGLPPTTASHSANAFAIGIALGLLTNTEIITKVSSR
jgi:hypothetical protein